MKSGKKILIKGEGTMEPVSLSVRVFTEVYKNQTKLIESIVAATNDIGLVKLWICSKKLKGFEKRIASIQEEFLKQEMMFEQPTAYLNAYRGADEKADSAESVREGYAAVQVLIQGQLAERRTRITSLFQQLKNELTNKKTKIQSNRTLLLSLIAVLAAVASLALNYFSRR